MNYDFRKYLNAAGLGESAPVRRRKANVKPKKFNPIAFAESYKFIAEDGKRMALSNNRLNNQLRGIAAKGEAGAEEFKAKVKEGMSKVKKVLIELYDKIIRFFTETVRYWMSNERKIAKVIANLQSAKKNSNKKESFSIPYVTAGRLRRVNNGAGESYYGFGEEGEENAEGSNPTTEDADKKAEEEVNKINEQEMRSNLEKALKSGRLDQLKTGLGSASKIEEFEKEIEKSCNILSQNFIAVSERLVYALPFVSASFQKIFIPVIEGFGSISSGKTKVEEGLTLDEFKSNITKSTEALRKQVKVINDAIKPDYSKNMKVKKANYVKVVDILISMLNMMKDEGRGMRSLNQQIRGFTEAKRKLQASFKENKNPSEAETLGYQISRTAIQTQTSLANMYIGVNDKLIGVGVQLAGKVAAAA